MIGCWYGAAHFQRITRCLQPLSGHRRGCQMVRCSRTPHSHSHRPTVFGRVASAGAKSDCALEVLECSLTPWAPRSDLHHRSGQGAFERLREASPEVGTACRDSSRRPLATIRGAFESGQRARGYRECSFGIFIIFSVMLMRPISARLCPWVEHNAHQRNRGHSQTRQQVMSHDWGSGGPAR